MNAVHREPVRLEACGDALGLVEECSDLVANEPQHLVAELSAVEVVDRVELLNVYDHRVEVQLLVIAVKPFGVLEEEIPAVKHGEAVGLRR